MKEQIKKIKKQDGKVVRQWSVQRGTFDLKAKKMMLLVCFLSLFVWVALDHFYKKGIFHTL